jgi:hypothetical protein
MDAQQILSRSLTGHSTTVQMRLHINGMSLPVAQAGRDVLKLQHDFEVAPGPASLEIVVDGDSRTSSIRVLGNTDARWLSIAQA